MVYGVSLQKFIRTKIIKHCEQKYLAINTNILANNLVFLWHGWHDFASYVYILRTSCGTVEFCGTLVERHCARLSSE